MVEVITEPNTGKCKDCEFMRITINRPEGCRVIALCVNPQLSKRIKVSAIPTQPQWDCLDAARFALANKQSPNYIEADTMIGEENRSMFFVDISD